jgi:hypothetical protein
MLKEHETVALTHDLPEHGLVTGDVGAIVYCYADGKAYEVEFVAANGQTVAVVTLTAADVRPLEGREILHVRDLAAIG